MGELGWPGCRRREFLASSAGDGRGSYRDGDVAMELLMAWPEAMTIGLLLQCQRALFDGVSVPTVPLLKSVREMGL